LTQIGTVEWHIARKTPQRAKLTESKDVFAGGRSVETALTAGVQLIRVSAWPQGHQAAPVSFAVIDQAEE